MLRMIAVDWDVNPPRIAAAARVPLRADTAFDGKLRYHASTHDRIPIDGGIRFAQVAVENAIDVRYARDGRALRAIESVDDGKVWWFEEPDAFASYRTAGSLHLLIDTVECEIEIRPSEFSSTEFDELLADFSGTLWEILMAEESAVVISGVRDVGDNCAELIRRLERFVWAVRGVLAAPHKTLDYAIITDRPGKIRPIPATYRDWLRRPAARQLLGRSQREIFDTAENRYLLRLCQWAQEVAARCHLAASRKGHDLDQCLAAGRRQIEARMERMPYRLAISATGSSARNGTSRIGLFGNNSGWHARRTQLDKWGYSLLPVEEALILGCKEEHNGHDDDGDQDDSAALKRQ